MKKILTLVSVIAMVSLLIIACKKKDEVIPDSNGKFSSLRTGSCEACCEDDNVCLFTDYVDTSLAGSPTAFDPIFFNFCDGELESEVGAHIQLSKQFNSFVKGLNGWNVDYLDETEIPYGTYLSSIDCEDVEDAFRFNGNSGDYENEMGMNIPMALVGWYNYTPPNMVTPIRYLLVWKDCDCNGCLTNGDTAYILKVNVTAQINPGDASQVRSKIDLSYKCIEIDCVEK